MCVGKSVQTHYFFCHSHCFTKLQLKSCIISISSEGTSFWNWGTRHSTGAEDGTGNYLLVPENFAKFIICYILTFRTLPFASLICQYRSIPSDVEVFQQLWQLLSTGTHFRAKKYIKPSIHVWTREKMFCTVFVKLHILHRYSSDIYF